MKFAVTLVWRIIVPQDAIWHVSLSFPSQTSKRISPKSGRSLSLWIRDETPLRKFGPISKVCICMGAILYIDMPFLPCHVFCRWPCFLTDFHPRLEGLTGTPQQVGRIAQAYRVYFSDVMHRDDDDDDDYIVDHSIVVYFVGPDGEFVDFFPQLAEAPEIADRVAKHIRADLKEKGIATGGPLSRLFGKS